MEHAGAEVLIAGPNFGTGSSRDWAAKGTQLLGIKAVIARSFERIRLAVRILVPGRDAGVTDRGHASV